MQKVILIILVLIQLGCANSKSSNDKGDDHMVKKECESYDEKSKQCEIFNLAEWTTTEKKTALGLLYLFGGGDTDKDYSKAFFFLDQAAKEGNVEAINGMGIIYLYGLGQEKKIDLAESYFKKANSLGDKVAKINLGELYKEKNDFNNSKKWYQLAIKDNPYKAYEGLSKIYIEEGNFKEAYQYSEEAAKLNNPEAEYNLGVFL